MELSDDLRERAAQACYDADHDKDRSGIRYYAPPEAYVEFVFPIIRDEVIGEILDHFRLQAQTDEGNWSHFGVIDEIEREFK